MLNGTPFTIIGVLPATLKFPFGQSQVWAARVYDLEGLPPDLVARGTGYLDVGANIDLGAGMTLQLHAGNGRVAGAGNDVWNWNDAKIGLSKAYSGGWAATAALTKAFPKTSIYDNYTLGIPNSAGVIESSNPGKATLVLSITTFDTVDEAVRLANDSPFGLAAGVWSSNIETAISVAKRILSGTVWINAYYDAGLPFVMPMGGYKGSGIGRELGREGLDQYYETKAVHIRLEQG